VRVFVRRLSCAAVLAAAITLAMTLAMTPAIAAAQTRGPVQVTARVTPELIGVGEPITIELRVRAPVGSEIRFPALPDSNEVVEALDPRSIRDASTASLLDRTAAYRLIAWDTGQRTVRFGDITITRDGAETRYPVRIPALRVRSVLPADTTKRIPRDARALIAVPGAWWRVILAAIVVGVFAWFIWRAWRRRALARAALGPDASELAKEAFDHAARLGLIEAGEHGRFALTHVDVMRGYLARRFPHAGPSRTAREVADALVGSEFPILPERVAELLLRSEPIAFARARVSADEARSIATEARAIVHDVETALRARRDGEKRIRRRPL
jgi:hypothetical protein